MDTAPPPPIVSAPPVSFGRVAVKVGAGTSSLAVRSGGKVIARRAVRPGPRRISLQLPAGRFRGRIEAWGPGGRTPSKSFGVVVLPAASRTAAGLPGRRDDRLQRELRSLVRSQPSISGLYVQHLGSGCGAAVNAGAMFPAASTLKTAILLEAVRSAKGRPSRAQGRRLDQMILSSDDKAANAGTGRDRRRVDVRRRCPGHEHPATDGACPQHDSHRVHHRGAGARARAERGTAIPLHQLRHHPL